VWSDWWTIPAGIVGGLVLVWAVLVATLYLTKPGEYDLKEAMRLLPDLIRLVKRLAADPDTPRGVRIRLALLLLYLALPIDLIPDFIPVVGYLDDLIVAAILVDGILSFVDRGVILKYWPGSPELLERVARSARVLAAWVPKRLKARIFSPR
jgi:uncharacterized membrane protein YkvA (DUF1232 family)